MHPYVKQWLLLEPSFFTVITGRLFQEWWPKHYSVTINHKPISFLHIIICMNVSFQTVKKYITQWGSSHAEYSPTELYQSSWHHNLVIGFEMVYGSLYFWIVSSTPCIKLILYQSYLSPIFSHQTHTHIHTHTTYFHIFMCFLGLLKCFFWKNKIILSNWLLKLLFS